VLPVEPLISIITLAEPSVGPLVARTEAERAARQAHLQQAEADFAPLPFDAAAARAFGQVAASLRRAGRKPVARSYDAMIAAVAVANGLPLYTQPRRLRRHRPAPRHRGPPPRRLNRPRWVPVAAWSTGPPEVSSVPTRCVVEPSGTSPVRASSGGSENHGDELW
jgi:predicted nucleic acid-binding protein